jgi:DNA-binding SARP family transcriptional activator
LIRDALASPIDGVRDVAVAVASNPVGAEELATSILRALGAPADAPGAASAEGAAPIDRLRAGLSAAIDGQGRPVVVVLDDLHRAGPEALGLVGELGRSLPIDAHLLVGGAGLGPLAVGPLLAEGIAERVGTDLLALPEPLDEAVVVDLLGDARRLDLSAAGRNLLDLAVALDQRRIDALAAIARALGGDDQDAAAAVAELERIPLVAVGATHLVIDERWRLVAAEPSAEDLRRAACAAGAIALGVGEPDEAGRLAVVARDEQLLRDVVRVALASQPPRVGAHDLRAWDEARVLAPDDPHAWWLDAACRSVHGAPLAEVFRRYVETGEAFRALGDRDAEIAVGLGAAIIARRIDDVGALVAFIGRAGELVAEGHGPAQGPALLGEALVWQMGGDPAAALATLDRLPRDAFDGDWAAQVAMVRGTNLALLDRIPEAIEQLSSATGWSGAWSSARALDLLAMTRWISGDAFGALDDLRAAEELAAGAGAADLAASVRASRAALAASLGLASAPELLAVARSSGPLDDESQRAVAIAEVLAAIDAGEIDRARSLLDAVEPVLRALPSTHWCVALQVALDADRAAAWSDVVAVHPALGRALAAGQAAASHLAEGTPVPIEHRPYLPARWCERVAAVVEVDLLGAAAIRRDGTPVHHRAWERSRVRELAAHLALVGASPREQLAADLWPELDAAAAAKNLRVTLTYLLDVIDPDRAKGEGSRLIVDQGGVLGLVDDASLRIDLRDQVREARAILVADARGDDPAVVAAARRLVRRGDGPLLGGVALGDWVDPHERERATVLLRAVAAAGAAALRVGDPVLAEDLGRRGLRLDPWAERLHQLVVRACLARDDLDGARRELRHAASTLADLGVRPEPATWALARQVGLRLDA